MTNSEIFGYPEGEPFFSHSETIAITGLKPATLLSWHGRDLIREKDVELHPLFPGGRGGIVGPANPINLSDGPTGQSEVGWRARWEKEPGRGNHRKYSLGAIQHLMGMRVLSGFGVPPTEAARLGEKVGLAMTSLKHVEVGDRQNSASRFLLVYPDFEGTYHLTELGPASLALWINSQSRLGMILLDVYSILYEFEKGLHEIQRCRKLGVSPKAEPV